MATIRKRPGPTGKPVWHAQVRKRGYPQQTRTFDKKSEADAWAREIEAEMDRGAFRVRTVSERTTIADLLDRYIKEVVPQKRSAVQIRSTAQHIRTHLGAYSVAVLQPKDVASYRAERLSAVQPDTVRKELGLLRAMLNVATKEWGLHLPYGNPVEQITLPLAGRQRERRLLSGEEARILAACRDYGGPLESLVILALETAMRRGELAAMRWEHVDGRVLRVPETKTGEPRRVPLSSRARAVLDALPRRLDGYVWGIRADSITQAFDRAVKRARADYEAECGTNGEKPDPRMLRGLRFHDLRHEGTSRLFERGLNPMEAAAITGHKTLQMLKRYTHLRAEDLVDRLG